MAYDARNLYTMAYGGGFTLWYYRCGDALGEVRQPGYFGPARRLLRHGDRLFVNAETGDGLVAQDFVVAASPTGALRLHAATGPVALPTREAANFPQDRRQCARLTG